jgi:hypothetical protein
MSKQLITYLASELSKKLSLDETAIRAAMDEAMTNAPTDVVLGMVRPGSPSKASTVDQTVRDRLQAKGYELLMVKDATDKAFAIFGASTNFQVMQKISGSGISRAHAKYGTGWYISKKRFGEFEDYFDLGKIKYVIIEKDADLP